MHKKNNLFTAAGSLSRCIPLHPERNLSTMVSEKCCHPILLWVLHFIAAMSAAVVALLLLFTLFTSRPVISDSARRTLTTTTSEECLVAHLGFSIVSLVFMNHVMKMISTGGHRDDFYRVEKDFKILAGLAIISQLAVAICGILIYVFKDDALRFEKLPEYTTDQYDKLRAEVYGYTTDRVEAETTQLNVGFYVLYLLIVDVAGLIVCIINVVVVVGCNKRERYDVELAVEKAMLSRQACRSRLTSASRSSSRHTLRS